MLTFGIDLGGTVIKAGLLDGNRLVAWDQAPADSANGLRNTLPVIEKLFGTLLHSAQAAVSDVIGIGFSFPGLVDSVHGRILSTNKKYDDAVDLDLTEWSDKTWGVPLILENDARLALLGEWQHGAGKGHNDLVMVTLGTGIGSAVLMSGKLLIGKHFQAGNLGGHFTVNHRGSNCTCGNIGCMESEASTWRLPELITSHPLYASSSLKNEPVHDYETLFRNAALDDPLALEIREHCFSVWSAGIISMIHAFDPEMVILGGGIMKSGSVILPALQERINALAWTPWGKVALKEAQNIHTAALFGADYQVRTVCKNRI